MRDLHHMPRKKADKETNANRHIAPRTTLELWVRSGGRCAICNDFLLEEPFFERPINLGERAHIAGWKESAGSPRGTSAVPVTERNKADNLVLLCLRCHKIVDDKETRADYPEDRLLEIKREHEDRIIHLTAMARDRETAVLRVFGAVRGSMPEMARDHAIQTVMSGGGRYARFPLSVDKHSIEIDLSSLPDPETVGSEAYWQMGRSIIDRDAARVAEAVHQQHIRHISIFALARIPFLVYLGYALDDKVPADLYQKHRGNDEGWLWPEEGQPAEFEVVELQTGMSSDIVLILSLSGTIASEDLPAEVAGLDRFEIRPVGVTPNPNLFRSSATLDAFSRTYQDFLARLEQTHTQASAIHLFPAVPITAALTCGRSLMRHVHPALHIYDRLGNMFQKALTVNER
jgi:hypothetical protein